MNDLIERGKYFLRGDREPTIEIPTDLLEAFIDALSAPLPDKINSDCKLADDFLFSIPDLRADEMYKIELVDVIKRLQNHIKRLEEENEYLLHENLRISWQSDGRMRRIRRLKQRIEELEKSRINRITCDFTDCQWQRRGKRLDAALAEIEMMRPECGAAMQQVARKARGE